MEESIYQLLKDFYTLKAEYDMNMQQLANTNKRLTADIEKLRTSFNELRDHVEENDERSGGE